MCRTTTVPSSPAIPMRRFRERAWSVEFTARTATNRRSERTEKLTAATLDLAEAGVRGEENGLRCTESACVMNAILSLSKLKNVE